MIEFILENYGTQIFEIICAIIITPIFVYLGMQVKGYLNTKEKQAVAKTVCKAIEQIYKDLNGEEKKQKALENISAMLAEKGITITELEMEMLIESAVYGFKQGINTEVKPEVAPETSKETIVAGEAYEIISEASNYTEAVASVLKEVEV